MHDSFCSSSMATCNYWWSLWKENIHSLCSRYQDKTMESMTLLNCNLFTIFCRILIKWQHIQITVFLVLQNKEKKKSGIKHSVKGQQVKNNPGIIFIKILQNYCWFLGRKITRWDAISPSYQTAFEISCVCIATERLLWRECLTFKVSTIHLFCILYRPCNKEA